MPLGWSTILAQNPGLIQSGQSLTQALTHDELNQFLGLEQAWHDAAINCYSRETGIADWQEWLKNSPGLRLMFYADVRRDGLSYHLPILLAIPPGVDCRNSAAQHQVPLVDFYARVKARLSGHAASTDASIPLWANTFGKWKTAVSPHQSMNTNNDVEFDVAAANADLVEAGKELLSKMTREELAQLAKIELDQFNSETALNVDLSQAERQHDFDNWTKTYQSISNSGYRLLSYEGLQEYPWLYPPSLNASFRFPKYSAQSRFKQFVGEATALLKSVRERLLPHAAPIAVTTTTPGAPSQSSGHWLLLLLLAAVYFLTKGKKA